MELGKITKIVSLTETINMEAFRPYQKVGFKVLNDLLEEMFQKISTAAEEKEKYFIHLYLSSIVPKVDHRVLLIEASTYRQEDTEDNDFKLIYTNILEKKRYENEVDKIALKSILFDVGVIFNEDYQDFL